jgi:hypothetical protein
MKAMWGKPICLLIILTISAGELYSQAGTTYQKGFTAEQNLRVIGRLNPYSPGGVGFDNRYQGVRGSPFLYDSLYPALVKINSEEKYLTIKSDFDIYGSRLVFAHPVTGQIMYLPANIIDEVLITVNGQEKVFRTTRDKKFETAPAEEHFFEILYSGNIAIIRMPLKTLRLADYQKVYSTDRRYDEFDTRFQYYSHGDDMVFRKFTPGKKALIALFPGKKDLIESVVRSGNYLDKNELMQLVIRKIMSDDAQK